MKENFFLAIFSISVLFVSLGVISFIYNLPEISEVIQESSNSFTENSVTGMATTPTYVNILPSQDSTCSFSLTEGWHLVSFYCLGMYIPRDTVMLSINGNYEKMFYYVPSDSADKWKSYNPSLPSWAVQQLSYMDRMTGYWIYINSSCNYLYEGAKRDSQIPLIPGWNLVSYPSPDTSLVNDSLQSVLYTHIKSYNPATGEFLVYAYDRSLTDLSVLESYRGYWINSTAYQNWNVYT